MSTDIGVKYFDISNEIFTSKNTDTNLCRSYNDDIYINDILCRLLVEYMSGDISVIYFDTFCVNINLTITLKLKLLQMSL